MTSTTETPLATDRETVERFLAARLSAYGAGDEVAVPVGLLGVTDALTRTPDELPDARLVVPVHLYQDLAVVGPAYRPGATAGPAGQQVGQQVGQPCPHCVALRWQKLRVTPERNLLERGHHAHPAGPNPYLTGFALDAIWRAVAAIVDRGDDPAAVAPGFPYLYEVRLGSLRTTRRPVIADPACPRCSAPPPDTAEGARLELRSRRKRSVDELRIRAPRDYRLPVDAFANPVSGMLGCGANHDYTSTTTSTVTGYIFTRSAFHLHDFFWSGHADVYDDSEILAVFEGLERYAGLHRTATARGIVASYRDLGDDALDPRSCGLYDERFAAHLPPYLTPYRDDLEFAWTWAWSLRDEKPLLVPEQFVYYLDAGTGPTFVQECSNGCASGSCLEEAVLYGMLELIERDAFLLAWYGKADLPRIDPASLRSPAVGFALDRIDRCGYDVRLLDNRIDLPIPVVTAVAVRRDGGLGSMCLASGAGFDPEDAIRAALCEIATYVVDFEHRVEEELDRVRTMVGDYDAVGALHDHPLLFGVPEMLPHAEFMTAPGDPRPVDELYAGWDAIRPRTLDLRDDVRFCRDAMVEAGFDVLVADQTSPEQRAVGVRTACVIAPGMIPIDFGWRKQRVLHMPRTFEAFRRAGMRDTDLSPDDLHLVPHPFP